MNKEVLDKCLFEAIKASVKAGEGILEVYDSDDFDVEIKSDNSPLTKADKKSNEIIMSYIESLGFPVLSEEGKELTYQDRKGWETLWCVDPLDGTKEFIKKNGEFTVNVALIHKQSPIIGVIYVPVSEELYFAHDQIGSFKITGKEKIKKNHSLSDLINESDKLPNQKNDGAYKIVASRSHMSAETLDFVEEMKVEHGEVELLSKGSALKICLVAEGLANVYPRFAPTMEWDTAAGHAIVNGASKSLIDYETQKPMKYNREQLRNNWFTVI